MRRTSAGLKLTPWRLARPSFHGMADSPGSCLRDSRQVGFLPRRSSRVRAIDSLALGCHWSAKDWRANGVRFLCDRYNAGAMANQAETASFASTPPARFFRIVWGAIATAL